jgi:agmatinase
LDAVPHSVGEFTSQCQPLRWNLAIDQFERRESPTEFDTGMGFSIVGTWETEEIGVAGVVEKIRERVDGYAVYLSIDIDVLDPAFAPGTGTPEIGGFSTRELVSIIRGLNGLPVVGLDVVEVAPAYDHAESTALAAANLAYDVVTLMAAAST